MTAPDLSHLSDSERKTYLEGMAIVNRKREAAAKAKADHEAEQAKRSAQALVKRMGTDLARKCFGVSSQPSKAPAPPASTKRGTYKFMSISYGERQTARRLART